MRIAVTYDEESGAVYQHFGHTEKFKLYDVQDGRLLSSLVIPAGGIGGHSALAAFLAGQGVDAVICGGIGLGMQEALMRENLLVFGGVQGSADGAVQAFLEKRLVFDPNAGCIGHASGEDEGCGCGHHHAGVESGCGCGHHHADVESGCGCGHHHEGVESGCGCGGHHENGEGGCGCHGEA